MKEHLRIRLQIAAILVCIVVAILIGLWVSYEDKKEIETMVREKIEAQAILLMDLAELTDSNGADGSISQIVIDCPRRNEYEALLNELSVLSRKDLLMLQVLSESCGGFYSERKALMVAKFERELQSYTDLINLLSVLRPTDPDSFNISDWAELVKLEKNRSTLLTDQNLLQEKIISSLISGQTTGGTDIKRLVTQAQEIRSLLDTNGQDIDALRGSLKQ